MNQEAQVISRICRWCGQEAEDDRLLAGPGWRCNHCGRWQDFGPCPCCGMDVSTKVIDDGLARLRQMVSGE